MKLAVGPGRGRLLLVLLYVLKQLVHIAHIPFVWPLVNRNGETIQTQQLIDAEDGFF